MPTVWEIDVKKVATETVVRWCFENHQVNRMVVGISMCRGPGKKLGPCKFAQIRNARRFFGDFVLAKLSVSGIPGTIFYGCKHPVLVIDFNEEVARRVVALGPRLTDWDSHNALPLPRDLCFYRTGARFPNLVTVAHEGDAWLLSDQQVHLKGVRPTHLSPADIYVHRGPHFCRDVRTSRFPFMKRFELKVFPANRRIAGGP
jgi:hypothetical protein